MKQVTIIGAGLAGCEAAYQLSKQNVSVILYDMKPQKHSPAHVSDTFAELVCSNSLRSDRIENAAGLLKAEMRLLDSLIMRAADKTAVPAGGALAVNRHSFSKYITEALQNDPNIEIRSKEITSLEEVPGTVIIATGPLTSPALYENIKTATGTKNLFFYDAAAPVVYKESIDMSCAFSASRYDRGSDYLNCPMSASEYSAFYEALISAECAGEKEFEQNIFEGCMPVEVMAKRGAKTLLFGPLKPVGLKDPATGKTPFAVVQLRKEDAEGRLYNLVGFQTHLKFPEQKRVFSMIPALKNAEFARYGVMHRNTYLDSPRLLDSYYRLKKDPRIFFAGQITGVEGYIESSASGLLAGIFCGCAIREKELPAFSNATAIGALANYISTSISPNFQPMNINFGIMKDTEIKNKTQRQAFIAERALNEIKEVLNKWECSKEQQL